MEKSFEFVVPFFQYKQGSKNTKVFKNEYGKWTVVIIGINYYVSLLGIIVLDPAFDEKMIDLEQINVEVNRNSNGNVYHLSVNSMEKTIFSFETNQQNNYSSLNYEFYIKIKMPEIASNESKQIGAKSHLKSLFDSGDDADITIKTEDGEIKAHKLILKRSEVFAKMLGDNMKEAQSGVIEIKDIEYDVIFEMCRFLYYDEIPKIESLALPLLAAADKYSINDLANKCKQFLMTNITIENFHDVLITADQLNKEKLREAAIDYIIGNRKLIFPSSTWKTLKENHMSLAMLVMEKFMLKDA